MSAEDRHATQEFAVRNALVSYCGQMLTPDLIDRIVAQLVQEMRSGATAWAFGRGAEAPTYYCKHCGVMEGNWHMPTCPSVGYVVRRPAE